MFSSHCPHTPLCMVLYPLGHNEYNSWAQHLSMHTHSNTHPHNTCALTLINNTLIMLNAWILSARSVFSYRFLCICILRDHRAEGTTDWFSIFFNLWSQIETGFLHVLCIAVLHTCVSHECWSTTALTYTTICTDNKFIITLGRSLQTCSLQLPIQCCHSWSSHNMYTEYTLLLI